jgi:hypothetical protein
MRLIFPLVLLVLFVSWILYHILIKKDLSEHKNDLYLGIFFFAIWALIYWFLLK